MSSCQGSDKHIIDMTTSDLVKGNVNLLEVLRPKQTFLTIQSMSLLDEQGKLLFAIWAIPY